MSADNNLVITTVAGSGVTYSLHQVNKPHVFSNYSSGIIDQPLLTVGANLTTNVVAAGKVLDDGTAPTLPTHLTNKAWVDLSLSSNYVNLTGAQTISGAKTFSSAIIASGGVTGTINTATQNSITTMTGLTSIGSSGNTTSCAGQLAAGNIRSFGDSYYDTKIGLGIWPSYPLHIVNYIAAGPWGTVGWAVPNQYQTNKPDLVTANVSAYFAEIVAAKSYIAFSDRRIKTNIIDIDDVSALETLRQIKPRRYNYIDTGSRSSEPVWGFIAQEVRETLPYSTVLTKNEIPNIFDMADVSNNNTITLINKSTSLFSRDASGNLYQLLLKDITSKDIKVTIAEIIDDNTFTIIEPLTAEQTGEESPKIFVYGSIVDDFHNLDKNAIFTIATAALQELDREYQQTKQEVITLKSQNEALQTRLDAIELRLANAGI